MARSRVGENQGFLNDADFVDGLKITVFIGAYITARHAISETLDENTAMGKIWAFYQGLIGLSKATLDPKMMTFANMNLESLLKNQGGMIDKIADYSLALQAAQLAYKEREWLAEQAADVIPGVRWDEDTGTLEVEPTPSDVKKGEIHGPSVLGNIRMLQNNIKGYNNKLAAMEKLKQGRTPHANNLRKQIKRDEALLANEIKVWNKHFAHEEIYANVVI